MNHHLRKTSGTFATSHSRNFIKGDPWLLCDGCKINKKNNIKLKSQTSLLTSTYHSILSLTVQWQRNISVGPRRLIKATYTGRGFKTPQPLKLCAEFKLDRIGWELKKAGRDCQIILFPVVPAKLRAAQRRSAEEHLVLFLQRSLRQKYLEMFLLPGSVFY